MSEAAVHPRSQQPIETEQININCEERLAIRLENGLVLRLPRAIETVDDMGNYEWATLAALETEEGLQFALDSIGSGYEVNLQIGDNWSTTAAMIEHENDIVLSLYHGAN